MSRMSISMCEKEGVPSVITMCRACAASATRSESAQAPRSAMHPCSSSSCAPVSSKGITPFAHGIQARGVVVDPDDAQPAVGERERERQPDAAEADHGDVGGVFLRGHGAQVSFHFRASALGRMGR